MLAGSSPLAAQSTLGVHEHVAPLAPGVSLSNDTSPHFTRADGLWNHGEGFGLAEGGGWLSFDDGSALTVGNIRVSVPWTLVTTGTQSAWRLVGYLHRDDWNGNAQTRAIEAAFELFVPATFDFAEPTVFVQSVWATIAGNAPANGGRFAYPGNANVFGLRDANDDGIIERPGPLSDRLVAYSGLAEADGHNVVAGYILPRGSFRDLTSQLQRALQFERAVDLILNQPSGASLRPPPLQSASLPLADYTVVASGGSMGGFVSQLLPILWPARYHGAVPNSFSGLVRRTVDNQASFEFAAAVSGHSIPGNAFQPRDVLEWSMPLRQLGATPIGSLDFSQVSFVRLFDAGLIQRPCYFLFSDEDGVTNGNEWASLLSKDRSYHPSRTVANVVAHADVHWSCLEKACHDANTYELPAAMQMAGTEAAVIENDIHLAPLPFLKFAVASRQNNPSPTHPSPWPAANDASLDAYDHVVGRVDLVARAAPNPDPTFLTADASFRTADAKHEGLGTWLGHRDSLVTNVETVGGTTTTYVYVGSADGVVSKLKVNPTTTYFELVAQSTSLGYGAWALDVSPFLANQTEVIVGTYRRLYVLDATTLAIQRFVDLPFEQHSPRFLHVSRLFEGSDSAWYALYATMGGQVVVRDANLVPIAEFSEPGIADLELPTWVPEETPWSRPILIQSERGHTVKLQIRRTAQVEQPDVELLAASAPLFGQPGGLVDRSGTTCAALQRGALPNQTIIELADADLATQASVGNAGNTAGSHGNQQVSDLDFGTDGTDDWYVSFRGGNIALTPVSGSGTERIVPTWSYAPCTYPLDIEVVDLASGPGHDGDELIVATESGQLVWISLNALTAAGGSFAAISTAHPNDAFAHTYPTVVATWGMTVGPAGNLQVLDQTARQFQVTPAGAVSHVVTFRDRALRPLEKPFRDLVDIGYTMTGQGLLNSAQQTTADPLARSFGGPEVYLESAVAYPSFDANGVLIRPPTWQANYWHQTKTTSSLGPGENTHSQTFLGRYAPLSHGGDVIQIGDDKHAYWWKGNSGRYQNQLVGIKHDATLPDDYWASSRATQLNDGAALFLRNYVEFELHNQQSLRVATWPSDDDRLLLVASTMGGSVVVVDPARNTGTHPIGEVVGEFAHQTQGDYGMGGMALTVGAPSGATNDDPQIFFGTTETQASHVAATRPMVSSIVVLKFTPGATPPTALTELQHLRLDADGVWGVAGMALGSLDADPEHELVVTSMNGDVLVYDLVNTAGSWTVGSLLYRATLPGAAGTANGLLVRDLDGDQKNELYVATSMGIRRFVQ